jgi:hypothetical protein
VWLRSGVAGKKRKRSNSDTVTPVHDDDGGVMDGFPTSAPTNAAGESKRKAKPKSGGFQGMGLSKEVLSGILRIGTV